MAFTVKVVHNGNSFALVFTGSYGDLGVRGVTPMVATRGR